jgi:glycosyltransferase involved in cell wall biosynthesis
VKEFEPDIIHAHSTFAGALVRIMFGWRHDRPVLVYCPHGWAFNIQAARWKLFAVALAERFMAPFCDRIIAISHHEAKEAMRIGIDPAKIEVIRNAIPLTAPAPAPVTWPDTRRKILFIGRLDRQKGFDILAEAVAGLEQDFVVRVAGAAVTSSACASGAPHIEFLGWLTTAGIEGHLRCADLVVMPSRWEGFGLTALEAMRAGKPVIAAAVGGLPEVVVSGVTGRLVPPGDANALRHALRALDAKALNRMGEQGQKHFRREFTIDRMHQSLVDLYTNLAAPRIRAGWPAVQS